MKFKEKLTKTQIKVLIIAPLIIIPLILLLLWSIGILPVSIAEDKNSDSRLNPNLPNAISDKDSNWNKLKFYEKADSDSARYRSMLRDDPYFGMAGNDKMRFEQDTLSTGRYEYKLNQASLDPLPANYSDDLANNEAKAYQKIAILNENIRKASKPKESLQIDIAQTKEENDYLKTPTELHGISKRFMTEIGEESTSSDPEMQQISSMLDKIINIQHPELLSDKKEANNATPTGIYLRAIDRNDDISVLAEAKNTGSINKDYFYPINYDHTKEQNTIDAIIEETQVLTDGSTIRLYFTGDVQTSNFLIPKETPVYGQVTMDGDRLLVKVTSIKVDKNIFAVNLKAFDQDGQEGIYIPGSITRESAKENTERAIQSLNVATLDPSIGAQAASAGIQAAKSLIGKKTKLLRVTVRSGYQVLLKSLNQK